MGLIEGVILDSSVLFHVNVNGGSTLSPAAHFVFRALHFSNLRKGIHFGKDLSSDEVNLQEMISKEYGFDCFHSSESTIELLKDEVALAWSGTGVHTLYVVSGHKKDLCLKLSDCGFSLSVLDGEFIEDTNLHPSIRHIKKLEQLPLDICCHNKKAAGKDFIIVGYNMKPSRQRDFAKEMIFLPLTYELPMQLQLEQMDVVLHKATDDIVSIELNTSMPAPKITYTDGMDKLRRTLEDHPDCCVIDPLNNIYPVMDRLRIQDVLLGLENLTTVGHSIIRGAHFLKVDSFDDLNLGERLVEAKLSLPSIVKPQVACGVSNAHSMAIVFSLQDYKDLPVPLPAIIQEYVDHSSTLFKFYVLGEKVFHAVKKSTANSDVLMKVFQGNQLKPLVFDSLKSLPTAEKNEFKEEAIDLELVKDAASWLRRKLNLTIFGFDVVIQDGTGDHVIVDVNYLPSFKEIPDDEAIPAFWEAIKSKFRERREGKNS
ncbi:inositol 1,3,4-trisphosphate 5/6-kinase 4 isoform X2 [Silene latifolia]|uniref:inositol 1,3,4-trisphosphate 5/6-kinase 4 isoform X2 n=1 Tax=Silene latifolia TaxID=37657 RepID=UPI003D77FB12